MLKKIYQKYFYNQLIKRDGNERNYYSRNFNNNNSKLKNNNKINKAFSLIEVSIVIMIIGIMVSGITTFSRLVKQMKLTSVKQVTYSSPVANIKGLTLWMETTLDSSVSGVTNAISPDENEKITSWNDMNPQTSNRIVASQTNDALRPVYTTAGTINELPALKFDGAQYLASIKANSGYIPLVQGDDSFTLIAVWQSNVNTSSQVIIDQNSLTEINGARAGIFLSSSGTYGFSGQGNDFWSCQQYFPKIPYISAITFADNGTTKVYTNSTIAGCTATLNSITQNISDQGLFIGVKGASTGFERMNGLIQEIIIFERVLSDEELKDVLRYLSKKFAIRIS